MNDLSMKKSSTQFLLPAVISKLMLAYVLGKEQSQYGEFLFSVQTSEPLNITDTYGARWDVWGHLVNQLMLQMTCTSSQSP